MTLHIMQYSYGLMTGSANVCFIDYINCTAMDGWKKYTKEMVVATEFVQK